MKNKLKLCKRNPLHNHPLLKKGGIHQKSKKCKRHEEKMRLKKEWLLQNILFYNNFI